MRTFPRQFQDRTLEYRMGSPRYVHSQGLADLINCCRRVPQFLFRALLSNDEESGVKTGVILAVV